MRLAREVHSKELLNNWAKSRKRKLNTNGKGSGLPFKERPKVPVTLRLDVAERDTITFNFSPEGLVLFRGIEEPIVKASQALGFL